MDSVDAQVHLNRLGSDWQHTDRALIVDYAVVTMDALGSRLKGVTVNQYGAWYFTDAWLDS
jgi:hypothetical protein